MIFPSDKQFSNFFLQGTGLEPYPYQIRLATDEELPELLNVPTGMGKTATAVLGWMFRRRFHPDQTVRSATPRRLVYCLPMRMLVEQTYENTVRWLERLGLLAGTAQWAQDDKTRLGSYRPEPENTEKPDGWAAEHQPKGRSSRIAVHLLMGGAEATEWDRFPEREAILIGTQDMLLSRALNRGYGMSRYRWPMHFALVSNDCLWVMDETQLMGVGLTTTVQLQGLREKFSTYGIARSLWMSATLDSQGLKTVDHVPAGKNFKLLALSEEDKKQKKVQQRIDAKKPLNSAGTFLSSTTEKDYSQHLAEFVASEHEKCPGTLTLVVLNRVPRAQEVFNKLQRHYQKTDPPPDLALIHARFRPADRKKSEETLHKCTLKPAGRIIIATQAIEAGVDVSATTLITELAPWPSLVQRFGRCNRKGECGDKGNPAARIFWIDLETRDAKDKPVDKYTLPYSAEELETARQNLQNLTDAGPKSLKTIEYERVQQVVHTLRRKDLLELWDTTPDLSGNDLDVSRFIRDGDDNDVQFYWRDWDIDEHVAPPGNVDRKEWKPRREELCSVRVGAARDFLKKLSKQRVKFGWVWESLPRRTDQSQWKSVSPDSLRPGMTILLHRSAGGYNDAVGWTGDPKKPTVPSEHDQTTSPRFDEDSMDEELGTQIGCFVPLTEHLQDVAQSAEDLQEALNDTLGEIPWDVLQTAALWHDVGKAHEAFQNMLFRGIEDESLKSTLWAKSNSNGKPVYEVKSDEDPEKTIKRPGFRHELASALAYLAHHQNEPDINLIAFLIAAHHGKVRGSIRSLPNEAIPPEPDRFFARGIWDGDRLPEVDLGNGKSAPPTELKLDLMKLGENSSGPSWLARTLELRDPERGWGPFRLTFIEMLLRIADWRGTEAGEKRYAQ